MANLNRYNNLSGYHTPNKTHEAKLLFKSHGYDFSCNSWHNDAADSLSIGENFVVYIPNPSYNDEGEFMGDSECNEYYIRIADFKGDYSEYLFYDALEVVEFFKRVDVKKAYQKAVTIENCYDEKIEVIKRLKELTDSHLMNEGLTHFMLKDIKKFAKDLLKSDF